MLTPWVAAGALLVALAATAWLLRRARVREAQLTQRVASAVRDLEQLQRAFGRFAPAEVVDEIAAQGVSMAPSTKEVTVLFADLRGFTAMSEAVDATVVVDILNGFFARMSRAITAHRGHVSKFIGDGILALFGALEPNPWQSNDAAHAALAMRDALADYNRDLEARGLPRLRMGVGVHRGECVAGVVGSDQLMEYTVLGASVNLASRVEGLTRLHDCDVLLTREARAGLDERFAVRELPPADVKGVALPVVTFALDKFSTEWSTPRRELGE